MVQQSVLRPSAIRITETYIYESVISGVRKLELKKRSGSVEIIVSFDKHKVPHNRFQPHERRPSYFNLMGELQNADLGSLEIKRYGNSNFNEQTNVNWREDSLPIKIDLTDSDLSNPEYINLNSFDLRLTHLYEPDEPKSVAIRVSVHILDEDYIDPLTEAEESEDAMLLKQIAKQLGLKHSLTLRFRVTVQLPDHLGSKYEDKPLRILQMVLNWPIALPHRLTKLRIGGISYPPVKYNPERQSIEWEGVPLKLQKKNEVSKLYTFSSDMIRLEVTEPIDLYHLSKLSGYVLVELNGVISGLDLAYNGSVDGDSSIRPLLRTLVVNEFSLDLEEGLRSKYFSPRQHLYFPGVVLNEMRVADVLMMLEDKGFELHKHEWKPIGTDLERNEVSPKRQFVVKAIRDEGAKKLEIFMLIRGIDANTTRERKILGNAKYTTPLATGDTSVYIRGQMPGDGKRVVIVINEIQKQLKEQFRHVGVPE